MRLLVCGSRHLPDKAQDWLAGWMRRVSEMLPSTGYPTLINGGAEGTDLMAATVARFGFDWAVECYAADWDWYGRSAGPRRNQQMIDEGNPDAVLAVLQEGYPCRGTRDMIHRSLASGLPTTVVTWRDGSR